MPATQTRPKPASGHPQPAAAAAPVTLESLFAVRCDDPIAGAFPGKRAVHPFVNMVPVSRDRVVPLWAELFDRPRTGRGVAYVHVPFCENHCLFCGFYQNAWRDDAGGAYVDAIAAQLRAFADTPAAEGPPLQAVYLGGGTPTALSAPDLARLIGALREYLPLVPDCEITLEGRIQSFGAEKACAAFGAGATRISLGVQSFADHVRRPLGRRAPRSEILRSLRDLVALDRGAVVIDLMYGLPRQTPADVAADVHLCADLGLDGLDLYSLNLIPGTPLLSAVEKGKLTPSTVAEMGAFFTAGEEAAEAEGWRRITTTHWQGTLRERNVYNLAVKTGADCLAFGAGAGGFLGGHNFRITSDLSRFQAAAGSGTCLTDAMMRQKSTVAVQNAIKYGMERGALDPRPVDRALADLAGTDAISFSAHAAPLLEQWIAAGLMRPYHRFLRLTRAGRFWQVAMTGRLLDWLGQHPNLGDPT
ncbi:MAG: heme anaerobic degradation radical SAM methyltransferase ChuW/HutW [Jhaorihella sp.]